LSILQLEDLIQENKRREEAPELTV